MPAWFENIPDASAVSSKLGLKDGDLDAQPTQVLNIPPYGNWTDQGWQIRFRGNVFKYPNISQDKIDDLANFYLIGTSMSQLNSSQQDQARNVTREIYVVQQGHQNVSFHLEPAQSQGSDGTQNGTNSIQPPGGSQNISLPYETTVEGDFEVFVPIKSNGLQDGNATQNVQRLNVYTDGTLSGNATAFLVPPTGITFISDIDDILRTTEIWDPKQGLLNTFAYNFTAWQNMPSIYANWSQSLPNNTHFHYLTTTPEQATRNYMDFIYKTYPGGSFDTRPLNFSNISATLSIRMYLLQKVFETFPQRKFVLVADTSNSDVMRDYPSLAHIYPNQVQCIFLRNTSATASDWFPYDTSGFKGLNSNSYMFFINPDDLTNLDIANGQCLNQTIKQNVTFGKQDEYLKDKLKHSAAHKTALQTQYTTAFITLFVVVLMLL